MNTKENKCEKVPEWEKLTGVKPKEPPKGDAKNSESPPLQGLGRTDPIAAEMAAITHGQGPTVTNREPVRLGASDIHAEIAKNTPKLDYKTSSEAAAKAASGAEFNKDDKNDKALKMPTTAVQDFEKGKKDARDENFDNKELNRNPDYLAGALAGDKEALAEAARNKGGDNTVAEQAKSTCRFPCLLPEQQRRLDEKRATEQAVVDKALGSTQPAATTQQPPVTPVALTPQEQIQAAQNNTGLRNNGIVKNDKGEFGWWGMSRKSGQLEFVPIDELRNGVPIGFHPDNRGSGFGDCNGRATCHQGVDWTDNHSKGSYQPVYSRFAGTVTAMGVGGGRTGNRIWIRAEHGGNEEITVGAFHMSKFAEGLQVGSRVNVGQYLGDSGNTTSRANDSFIAHLHDETRVNGIPVEPSRVTRYLYPTREALLAQVQNIPVQSASAWQPPVGSVYDTTAYLPRSDVIA
ncbi:M23 family metallopeptidase, partial [bacterium]|nr:M23 family metallopeptidase [bacterium]